MSAGIHKQSSKGVTFLTSIEIKHVTQLTETSRSENYTYKSSCYNIWQITYELSLSFAYSKQIWCEN